MDGDFNTAPILAGTKPLLWTGLLGSSSTFELLRWTESQQQLTVVVCPSEALAVELHDQATFFHRSLYLKKPLLFYPARETDFVPSQYQSENIVDQRLSTLYQCFDKKPSIIITSLKALSQKTVPFEIFKKHIHALMLHDEPNREELIKQFIDSGYEREGTCRSVGDFSVRGDIVDFFSPNHANPIRVEFFGDQIERMCYFNPDSQTSFADQNLEYVEWIPCHEILLSEIDQKEVLKKIKNRAERIVCLKHIFL